MKTKCNYFCKKRKFSDTFEANYALVKKEEETVIKALCMSEFIASYRILQQQQNHCEPVEKDDVNNDGQIVHEHHKVEQTLRTNQVKAFEPDNFDA